MSSNSRHGLIKLVKGRKSEEEYEQAIMMLEKNKNIEQQLFTSSIFRTQYNLGGQIDDVSKLKIENLIQNKDIEHSNLSVVTKLPWGKNGKTTKQAPWQILLGAMILFYCNLLGIAR